MNPEQTYLFRHALVRDAAYELQPPTDRARLHALALQLIEDICGGAPDEINDWWDQRPAAHPTDPFAHELAAHAMAGAEADPDLNFAEIKYLWRAAYLSFERHRGLEAHNLYERLAQVVEPDSTARRAALCRAGVSATRAGLPQQSEGFLRLALAEAERAGDAIAGEHAAGNLANLLRATGRSADAKSMYDRAIAYAERNRRPRAVATSLVGRATLFTAIGNLNAARRDFLRAVEVLELLGDDSLLGQALGNMANLDVLEGRTEAAREHTLRALELARKAGDRRSEGVWICNLAVEELQRDRVAEAEAGFRLALSLARETGDRRSECVSLGNLADVLLQSGRVHDSRSQLEAALEQAREIRELRLQGVMLAGLARIEAVRGDRPAALRLWESASDILQQVGDRHLLLEFEKGLNSQLAETGLEPL